jgi:hypothetical protein
MDKKQAQNDGRDNQRAFRWGIVAVIVLVVLAIAGYRILSERRGATSTMQPSVLPAPAEAPKPPGQ